MMFCKKLSLLRNNPPHLGGEVRRMAGLEHVVERNGVIVFDIDAQDDPEQS